jgi:hypothetical protein
LQQRDDVGNREAEEDVMHDLDRAMFEAGLGGEQEYGYESTELEQEEFLNVLGEVLGQSNGASPQAARGMPERRASAAPSRSSAQDETEEMELALELLQVSNEEELEGFFSDLVNRAQGAWSGAKEWAKTDTGKNVTKIVKAVTSAALPVIGGMVGKRLRPTVEGQPSGEDYGKSVGGLAANVGNLAATYLGFELEGLSQEDREFETARALVHWAKDTAQRAAAMAPQATARPSAAGGATRPVPPALIAKAAAVGAAQRVAPGLAEVVRQIPVPSPGAGGSAPGEQSGRWVRRGNTVVLHGF